MKSKYILSALIAIGIIIAISISFANETECLFNIKFINDTDSKIIYLLYWRDHPWRDDYPFPANMAGGELQPREEYMLENWYHCGSYYTEWEIGGDWQPKRNFKPQNNMTYILRASGH